MQEARRLAGEYSLVPLRHTFIDDCETPVSAFLKLRALAPGEPAFLLESADQGQRVGRWSFIGFRPRAVMRNARGIAQFGETRHGRLDAFKDERRIASCLPLSAAAFVAAHAAVGDNERRRAIGIIRGDGDGQTA